MTQETQQEHREHEADAEEHFRWSADHMHALSVLRQVEAQIYKHESAIQKHRLAIMQHEQGTGGDMTEAHQTLEQRHQHSNEAHQRLLGAVLDLERLLAQ
ncbi:hypothetical protein [Thiohalorhabdus sp.]|uniref:hypothetical protein n=1 Tax=Thiohalorhabdus sp. TaxID=3094134 RepID=UPI002FC30F27